MTMRIPALRRVLAGSVAISTLAVMALLFRDPLGLSGGFDEGDVGLDPYGTLYMTGPAALEDEDADIEDLLTYDHVRMNALVQARGFDVAFIDGRTKSRSLREISVFAKSRSEWLSVAYHLHEWTCYYYRHRSTGPGFGDVVVDRLPARVECSALGAASYVKNLPPESGQP